MPVENQPIYKSNESFGQEKPDFDCGKFTIVFSIEPEGFEVENPNSYPRQINETPYKLTDSQKTSLRIAMQNQFGHTTADKAKIALDEFRKNPNDVTKKKFTDANKEYKSRFSIIAGLRNFRRGKNNNTLVFDTRPVSFPASQAFARVDSPAELKEFSSNSSTTVILETADEKAILQFRHNENVGWPLTPASTASGYLDQTEFRNTNEDKPKEEHRRLKRITTQDVKDNAIRELDEEVGIQKVAPDGTVIINDSDIVISSMVHEKGAVHDEFLVMVKTKLTADKVLEYAQHSVKNEKLHDKEFREKYVVIDSSAESIKKLVTQVKCPIPYAHCAAWITKGYHKMLERGSIAAADKWKAEVEEGVRNNYTEIDKIVESYYEANPQVLQQIPERRLAQVQTNMDMYKKSHPNASSQEIENEKQKQLAALPKRNPKGYSSAFTPEEQGLPSVDSELKRLGILR